jgi:hypothetical protein
MYAVPLGHEFAAADATEQEASSIHNNHKGTIIGVLGHNMILFFLKYTSGSFILIQRFFQDY